MLGLNFPQRIGLFHPQCTEDEHFFWQVPRYTLAILLSYPFALHLREQEAQVASGGVQFRSLAFGFV